MLRPQRLNYFLERNFRLQKIGRTQKKNQKEKRKIGKKILPLRVGKLKQKNCSLFFSLA